MILESWKEANDKNKVFSSLLVNLSNAFDSLNHDLLIAKLYVYGLEL